MRKLHLQAKPVELTNDIVTELTNEFIRNGTSVWKRSYIITALLAMSNNKCCYCECKIDEESKYMEVEHFHPVSIFPNEVLLWENLLPSCKRCNGSKLDHNTVLEPIIQPVNDDPKEHIFLKNYRFEPKTPMGKTTIEIVDLNNRQRLQIKRFEIGSELIENLENLLDKCLEYRDNHSGRIRNRIIRWLEDLIAEGLPESEYSCTASTIMLNNSIYQQIKEIFSEEGLWNENFQYMEFQMQLCSVDEGH